MGCSNSAESSPPTRAASTRSSAQPRKSRRTAKKDAADRTGHGQGNVSGTGDDGEAPGTTTAAVKEFPSFNEMPEEEQQERNFSVVPPSSSSSALPPRAQGAQRVSPAASGSSRQSPHQLSPRVQLTSSRIVNPLSTSIMGGESLGNDDSLPQGKTSQSPTLPQTPSDSITSLNVHGLPVDNQEGEEVQQQSPASASLTPSLGKMVASMSQGGSTSCQQDPETAVTPLDQPINNPLNQVQGDTAQNDPNDRRLSTGSFLILPHLAPSSGSSAPRRASLVGPPLMPNSSPTTATAPATARPGEVPHSVIVDAALGQTASSVLTLEEEEELSSSPSGRDGEARAEERETPSDAMNVTRPPSPGVEADEPQNPSWWQDTFDRCRTPKSKMKDRFYLLSLEARYERDAARAPPTGMSPPTFSTSNISPPQHAQTSPHQQSPGWSSGHIQMNVSSGTALTHSATMSRSGNAKLDARILNWGSELGELDALEEQDHDLEGSLQY